MDTRRKRILFLAEGATMAHFVRLLSLADTLNPTEFEVHFHSPPRFANHLIGKPFSTGELATMPGEQFLANISKGNAMFPSDVLRGYVQSDCDLIRRLRPDLVIGDLRLTLPISAQLEGVRCAVLINAYWSPYAKRYMIIPEVPLTHAIPPRFLGLIYRLTEPLTYAVHVGKMNAIRKDFGLAPLPLENRAMFTAGDYVLYADVPEFVPTTNLPKNHYYVGNCPWAPATSKPEWWARMAADPKPKVFVSLGSSGPLKCAPALLRALAKLPVSTIVATSGRDLSGVASASYVTDLLPFTETAKIASVVVSHGGSGGLYPAIAAGTPVLGIPSNADQHLSTAVLKDSGAGLGVRVEEASERRLKSALEKLLFDPKYTTEAQRWAAIYSQYDSKAMFSHFLRETLASS